MLFLAIFVNLDLFTADGIVIGIVITSAELVKP
jgi:hypothetical protein